MIFTASLQSEFLKVKRTSLIYLILLAAFVVPFVMVFDHGSSDSTINVNGWDNFYREGFVVFACLFVPFFFILASTLLMQIEVRNHAWKQILASPQPFFNLLLSKFIVLQVLSLVFILVFNVYMVIGCAIIDTIHGINYLSYLNRLPELLTINLLAYGSNFGLSAICFWLALRFKNFIAPIAIGLLLWLIGPTAAFELKVPHFDKYVFILPFTIMAKKFENTQLFYQWLSIGYGVLFFSIAYIEFMLQRLSLNFFLGRSKK